MTGDTLFCASPDTTWKTMFVLLRLLVLSHQSVTHLLDTDLPVSHVLMELGLFKGQLSADSALQATIVQTKG